MCRLFIPLSQSLNCFTRAHSICPIADSHTANGIGVILCKLNVKNLHLSHTHFTWMHRCRYCLLCTVFHLKYYSDRSDIFIKRFKAFLHSENLRFSRKIVYDFSEKETTLHFPLFDKNHQFNVQTIVSSYQNQTEKKKQNKSVSCSTDVLQALLLVFIPIYFIERMHLIIMS